MQKLHKLLKSNRAPKFFLVFIAICLGVLWRLPLFINSEFLTYSDETANHLTIKHLFTFKEIYYYYHGMRYQGLTEGLLSLFFVPFFGFSALSQKLAGTLVYFFFTSTVFYFLKREIKSMVLKSLLVLGMIIPTTHLYVVSFMAYGGHLLNAYIGFLTLALIYWGQALRTKNPRRFIFYFCFLVALGTYTYRHFLAFYPVILVFLWFFRTPARTRSRDILTSFCLPIFFMFSAPLLNRFWGTYVQSLAFENLNSFMSFESFQFLNFSEMMQKIPTVFGVLWPNLFFTKTLTHFEVAGIIVGVLALVFLVVLNILNWNLLTREARLLRLSTLHVALILASTLVTPYSTLALDIRYLMPIYGVLPFFLLVAFKYFDGQKRKNYFYLLLGVGILGNIVNTLQFNVTRGIANKNYLPQKAEVPFADLINYLKEEKLNCIFMDYSEAYSLSLQSNEEVWASAINLKRIRRYENCAISAQPRIIALPYGHDQLSAILEFSLKKGIRYRVRRHLKTHVVIESYHFDPEEKTP